MGSWPTFSKTQWHTWVNLGLLSQHHNGMELSFSLSVSLSLYLYLSSSLTHLYSRIMLFSGAKPIQALSIFSSMALCFERAFTTGVPGGTCHTNIRMLGGGTHHNYKVLGRDHGPLHHKMNDLAQFQKLRAFDRQVHMNKSFFFLFFLS